MPEDSTPNLSDPEVFEEFEFSKENLKKLYDRSVRVSDPELWERRNERVQTEILFSDVVEDLTGKHGHAISCPFHGTDSTPSFYIYPPARGNMGYCFGCSAAYTLVTFVAKIRGISWPKAMEWLERSYNLPPLQSNLPPEDEDIIVPLKFEDLSSLYIVFARKDVMANKSYELAEEYLRIYFEAQQEHDETKRVKALAEVLGSDIVARVRRHKAKEFVYE
jgi:hypothetical protein